MVMTYNEREELLENVRIEKMKELEALLDFLRGNITYEEED